MRDVSLIQSSLTMAGPPPHVQELIDALKAAVSDDKEMDLAQFKGIVIGWLEKHHGADKVAAHKAEIDEFLTKAFKHVDTDESGTISAAELEKALAGEA